MFKLNKKEETKNSEFCQKDSIEFSQKSLDASWRGKALSSSLKCELFADFFLLLYIARAHIHRWARYFKKVAERALNAKKIF